MPTETTPTDTEMLNFLQYCADQRSTFSFTKGVLFTVPSQHVHGKDLRDSIAKAMARAEGRRLGVLCRHFARPAECEFCLAEGLK